MLRRFMPTSSTERAQVDEPGQPVEEDDRPGRPRPGGAPRAFITLLPPLCRTCSGHSPPVRAPSRYQRARCTNHTSMMVPNHDYPRSMTIPDVGTEAHSDRRRWIALVVVCLAMFMNSLDGSIVNVALPDIQKSLHFSQSGLTWVVDAYLISFGSFLLWPDASATSSGARRCSCPAWRSSPSPPRLRFAQTSPCSSSPASSRASAAPSRPRSSWPSSSPSSPGR